MFSVGTELPLYYRCRNSTNSVPLCRRPILTASEATVGHWLVVGSPSNRTEPGPSILSRRVTNTGCVELAPDAFLFILTVDLWLT